MRHGIPAPGVLQSEKKSDHLEAHAFVVRTRSPDRAQSANAAVGRTLNQITKHGDVAIAMPCILHAIWSVEVAGIHARIVVATARGLVVAMAPLFAV